MLEGVERPKVSVIVPAYQVAEFIGEAIESVLAQTTSDWELLIIDDGSRDNLKEVVTRYLLDARINLFSFPNGGLAEARNRGISLARGTYIAMLDGDDIYEPSYIERMAAELDADPNAVFVTCDSYMFGVPEREGRLYSQYEPQVPPITLTRVLERKFNVFGLCMVRADALREAGGYSSKLRAAEDLDLWIRLLSKGWHGAYVAAPLVRYRRRAGSLSNSPKVLQRSLANVYLDAMVALEGRPEEHVCREQLVVQLARMDMWAGEEALRAGDTKAGFELIAKALRVLRRPKWKAVLVASRALPVLADVAIRWRHGRQTGLERLSLAPSATPAQPTSVSAPAQSADLEPAKREVVAA